MHSACNKSNKPPPKLDSETAYSQDNVQMTAEIMMKLKAQIEKNR
jgi:hypothetical protein